MYQDNNSKRVDGQNLPHNPGSAHVAPSSANEAHSPSSGQETTTDPRTNMPIGDRQQGGVPLPAAWFRKDKSALVQELGQLSKGQLLHTLVFLLTRAPLPGQAPRADAVNGTAPRSTGIDLGPEYTTRDLAQLADLSPQGIVKRVHKLVAQGRIPERCTGRWTFDEEEARLILKGRGNGGTLALKK